MRLKYTRQQRRRIGYNTAFQRGFCMGNVIHTDGPGKRRDKIMRLLAALIAQYDVQSMSDDETRDKTAFVYLSLVEIGKTIDETVRPWEKREYWIKADSFRNEWAWVQELREKILENIKKTWRLNNQELELLENKLTSVNPLKRIDHQEFWKGAYQILKGKIQR
jgi:hypothetical protein